MQVQLGEGWNDKGKAMPVCPLPQQGLPKEQVLERLQALKAQDARWREGRVFSLVYYAGDDVLDLLRQASLLFLSENALNPLAFPSLRRMETEVVAIVAGLLGGDEDTVGNMTSGGTESILLAVKAARDWARTHRRLTDTLEILAPSTVHPAFAKAAHYLGMRLVLVPVGHDFRADPQAMARAITPNTVLLVGSAPSYPQGVMDPIPELAALAQEHGLLLHVDACVGGMFLPFLRRLGYPVPDFDFRLPGVTSISVDLHKYGYAAKGASVVLYRDGELRKHQFFVSTDWSGGIYASPGVGGTRPAGPIAAAWAVLHYLGEAGYLRLTRQVMEATQRLKTGIQAIPGLHVLGDPVMSLLAVASDRYDIYEVADELAAQGWHLDRQQHPPSLHLTVTPVHAQVVEPFLHDLEAAVQAVARPGWRRRGRSLLVRAVSALMRRLPPHLSRQVLARVAARFHPDATSGERSAPLYGLMGSLPRHQDVREAVLVLLDQVFRPPEEPT